MRLFIVGAIWGLAGLVQAEPALRYPVGLAVDEGATTAYTANERNGTLSVLDLRKGGVRELEIGGRPVDVQLLNDHLVVADAARQQLRFLKTTKNLTEEFALSCSSEPTRLAADGKTLAVSSTWGRRVEIYRANSKPEHIRTVHLEYSPREILFLAGGQQLFIADAFGGRYAIYDLGKARLVADRRIPAHNIRGLALDPGGTDILISHQILNSLARTTFNDIHWGVLMANVVRSIPLVNLRSRSGDILRNSILHRLGTTGPAAGDPGGIAVQSDRITLALSGVSAVLTGPNFDDLTRIDVGRRPTVVHTAGNRAFVANTFSDSITIIDLERREAADELRLGQPRELTAAEQGEQIFFDAKRSHNGWLSCHSCHTDGHSNGQLNDNLGDDTFGAPKRVLSLLGVGDTAPWAWHGAVNRLEDQINKSIESTMQGAALTKDETGHLKSFLISLKPPSPVHLRDRLDQNSVNRGAKLFTRLDCARCHTKPGYTSADSYDVDLRDELGADEFNPPSLRGLAHRPRFFHDNRAESLIEVFYAQRHQLPEELNPGELLDLAEFLRSL